MGKDKREKHDSSKRRLSTQHSTSVADHHNDEGQPKSKIPKIKSEDNATTDPIETKKLKPSGSLDSVSSNNAGKQELKMGRIPKIKTEKSDEKSPSSGTPNISSSHKNSNHAGKDHHHGSDEHKKHKHHSRSRHDEKGRSDKEDRHGSPKSHDNKKSSKSKERDQHKLKSVKEESSSKKRPRPHSSDEEIEHKRKHSISHSSSKKLSSRHGEKEHREEKDRRKSTSSSSSSHKPATTPHAKDSNSDMSENDSDGSEPKKFSIFDDPIIDLDNPVYFSMYDKVKARRSCVKDRVEQARRQQEELLAKFSKLKKKRAEKDGHRESRNGDDSDDSDSLSDSESDEELNTHLVKGRKKSKTSALISSSSGDESDDATNVMKSK